MSSSLLRFLLLCSSLWLCQVGWADDDVSMKNLIDTEQAETDAVLEAQKELHLYNDDYYRDNPQSSMLGFLRASRDDNFEVAAKYLDVRNLPDSVSKIPRQELASKLKIILDQRLLVDVHRLSSSNKGFLDDHLPSYRDRIGVISDSGFFFDVLYQRVPGEGKNFIWKFSNQTVAQIPQMYDMFGYNEFEQWLDDHVPRFRFLGVQSWLWMMVLIICSVVFAAVTAVSALFVHIVRRYRPHTTNTIRRFVFGPVRFMLVLYISGAILSHFHLSMEAQALAKTKTLHIFVNTWFGMMLIGFLRNYWQARLELLGKHEISMLMKPLASVLRLFLLIGAFLLWMNNLGVDITTLVAGLGIGGLAIALAAQRSLENLLGTITIFLTAPIKVGDFCLVQGSRGMVEEIGLWATKIRTLDRSVVFIPNSQVSAGVIENFSLRDKYTFSRVVYLAHETSEDKISEVMDAVLEVLENDKMVDERIRRVNLETIGEFGFEINIFAFISTTDLNEYKQTIAAINLKINNVVQRSGAVYAKPVVGGAGKA